MWLADDTATFNATTFDSRGTPNYGNIPVSVANSWNLVGNPYQAWINWTSLTKPTLNNTYYIWNTNNASYDAKTSGSIPPHQGFWVESTGSGTLTFTEASKNNSASSIFWKMTTAPDDAEPYVFTESILKIRSNKYPYAHELKLRLNDLASTELDEFDASFKASFVTEAPSIVASTKNSSKQLAITSFNRTHEVIIPISIKVGIEGKHIIEAISFDNLSAIYNEVVLRDTKTNKNYNLKTLKTIDVDLDLNEDENRFILRLSNNNPLNSASLSNANIYKNHDYTIIEFDNIDSPYSVSIVNMLGQKVVDDYINISKNKLMIPNSNIPSGINIITVRDEKNVSVKKLNY